MMNTERVASLTTTTVEVPFFTWRAPSGYRQRRKVYVNQFGLKSNSFEFVPTYPDHTLVIFVYKSASFSRQWHYRMKWFEGTANRHHLSRFNSRRLKVERPFLPFAVRRGRCLFLYWKKKRRCEKTQTWQHMPQDRPHMDTFCIQSMNLQFCACGRFKKRTSNR